MPTEPNVFVWLPPEIHCNTSMSVPTSRCRYFFCWIENCGREGELKMWFSEFFWAPPHCQLALPLWLSTLQFCHLNAGAHLPMCKTRFLWCFFAGVPMLHSGFSSAQDNCDWFKGAKCKDLNWKVANCYIFPPFKRNSDKQKCDFPQYQNDNWCSQTCLWRGCSAVETRNTF